jgi:hypothetical protein
VQISTDKDSSNVFVDAQRASTRREGWRILNTEDAGSVVIELK